MYMYSFVQLIELGIVKITKMLKFEMAEKGILGTKDLSVDSPAFYR